LGANLKVISGDRYNSSAKFSFKANWCILMIEQSWHHDTIDTNGIKLHYVTQGEGALMLFLHGFPEFWYSWRHQIPEFAKDHKVVAIDLRGYNDSDKPQAQSAYVMSEFVEDVKGVIEGLGYERCIFVSHGWGGAIASC
jgi:epoxide hydrolase 4